MDLVTYLSGAQPLFIGGMPKSGTTLLLSLLDSHPDILVFPEETKFLQRIATEPDNASLAFLLERTDCRYIAERMVSDDDAGVRDYTDFDSKAFRQAAKDYRAAHPTFEKTGLLLEAVVAAYGHTANLPAPKVWVEKTPLNEVGMSRAWELWPAAKLIYTVRDPRDIFCSYNAKRRVRARTELSLDEFALMTRQSLTGWNRSLKAAPLQVFLMRYEDLVSNPEGEMRRVAAFLKTPFKASMLQPTRLGRAWGGNSMHHGNLSGVSSKSVQIFRQLEIEHIREIEQAASVMMKRFGYPPCDSASAPAHL